MRILILMGPSGAGKSTWTRHYPGDKWVCSADHYFMNLGVYRFVPEDLPKAHAACLRRYLSILARADLDPELDKYALIVDNTNTTIAEIAPYVAVARAYDHEPHILAFATRAGESGGLHERSIHGVPHHAIARQHRNMMTTIRNWPALFPEIRIRS